MSSGPALALEGVGLRRHFGAVRAVDGVDLALERGEIFALVGPDGAGKTTLIRLLSCAIAADGGHARVAGFDIMTQAEDVKTRIGYMPQRFSLYGDLSVDENIRFYSTLYDVEPSVVARRSTALLDEFRLTPFRGRLTRDLSGGMKQKAALACTLIHAPDVLFLDEPTAGVDPVSRRQFWRILYDLNRGGITVFVSTPYMDEAERASRVGLIHHGRLVACDTPDALRALVTDALYEVVADPRREAARALQGHPLVQRLDSFGEGFHALVPADTRDVERQLRAAMPPAVTVTSVRRIAPSLEDVFVARLGS